MGIYLALYIVSLVIALALYYLSKKNEWLGSLSGFFVILMLFFFAFALATHDPIEEFLTTIPAFWQFLLTALGGAFAIWRVYLNPLKTKVYTMDRELGEVKATVTRIAHDIERLEHNVERVVDVVLRKKKKCYA